MELGTFTPIASGEKNSLAGYERLYIDHSTGSFKSSKMYSSFLSGGTGDIINAIPLGLIRKREMWPKRDGSNSTADGTKIARRGKQCLSMDGETGYPQLGFPWDEYREKSNNRVSSHAGYRPKTLECNTCPFKKWSSDGKVGPPCQPRWYIPLMNKYSSSSVARGEPIEVAILELTQSGITTFKEMFKNEIGPHKKHIFYWGLVISLTVVRRNGKQFARPSFNCYVNDQTEMAPIYTYYLREIEGKLTDASNIAAMGGSPTGLTALKPGGK